MGNLSFLIPTKNKDEFNIDKIFSLLQDKYAKLAEIKKYTGSTGHSITIIDKKDEFFVTCDILFNNKECYLLDNIPKNIPINERTILYRKLEEANIKDTICCEVNYGHWKYMDLRKQIVNSICEYYDCYFLDEGIFPIHMFFKNNIKYNVL